MLLSEIRNEDSLIANVLRTLMKTHTVHMWFEYDGIDHDVEIVDVEDEQDGWIKVHFGIPNQRTGDIDDATGWHTHDFEVDEVTVTKNDKGQWWLHEID